MRGMSDFDFRSLARSHFPLLGGWLAQPHVARWWAGDSSLVALEADYGGSIDGTEPSDVFIACRDGVPLGLVQRYRLDAYPNTLRELEPIISVPTGAASIDYLIGPAEALGRGWGTAMIQAFTERLWHDDPQASAVIVPVHVANRAAWRALERAGYARIASGLLQPDNPADDRRHYLYRIDPPAWHGMFNFHDTT